MRVQHTPIAPVAGQVTPRRSRFGPRSVAAGVIAAVAMAVFYVGVVAGVSGSWAHLRDQIAADWYLLVLVVTGFATQVALLTELRRRHRLQAAVAAASGGGAGASAVGMIACCAHHVADLVPFLGVSGAAAFLYDYKLWFVLVGVGVNALGVIVAARRLRRTPLVSTARIVDKRPRGTPAEVLA